MARRGHHYTHFLSSHPYHSTISSALSFCADGADRPMQSVHVCAKDTCHSTVSSALSLCVDRTDRPMKKVHACAKDTYHSTVSSALSFCADGTDRPKDVYYWTGPTEVSPRLTELPREMVSASDRFFVSPANTASLLDEAIGSRGTDVKAAAAAAWGAVAVDTSSKNPREDFLQSMAEMIVACNVERLPAPDCWDLMEELLFCYLELNDRAVYRHIFAAFADLTAGVARRRQPGRVSRRWDRVIPCTGLR